MQRIKYLIIALAFLSLLLPVAIAISVSSSVPLAHNPQTLNSYNAIRIKRITQQLKHGMKASRQRTIGFSQRDINALLAFITRKKEHTTASAIIKDGITHITISIHTPSNPFGEYLNIQTGIPSSKHSLSLSYLKLSSLTLPGNSALTIIRNALDHVLGDALGTELINAIKVVRVIGRRLHITYQPIQNITDKVTKVLARASTATTPLALPADPKLIPTYYAYLCRQEIPREQTSLGIYLSSLLTHANKQLNHKDNQSNAIEHNKALLYAMAIYLGTDEFNVLVGAISRETIEHCKRNTPKTTLMNRKDLSLHFIYSAAFKLISDSDISFSLGELKELQDSLYGGSGFSFVDLAADRVGIRFTEFATSPGSALFIQKQASLLMNESYFFPDTSGLQEKISQHKFENELGGIEGEYYQKQLIEINRRISQKPLYLNR